MHSFKRKLLCGGATFAVGLSIAGTGQAQTVVKIGSVAPLTGGMAHVG